MLRNTEIEAITFTVDITYHNDSLSVLVRLVADKNEYLYLQNLDLLTICHKRK